MAKQRYINTRFWSDSYIVNLNPLDRYFFLYLLTNEHTNICGIYELPVVTMANETGIEKEMLLRMMKRLKGKVYYIEGWVYLKNFAKHQAVNESVKKGIDNAMLTVPENILNKIKEINTVSEPDDSLYPPSDLSKLKPKLESKLKLESELTSELGSQINQVIDMFQVVNPSYRKFFANKTQRAAVERMLKVSGFDKLKQIIEFLPKSNTTQYMPVITTPVQLEDKMGQLAAGWQKIKSKTPQML